MIPATDPAAGRDEPPHRSRAFRRSLPDGSRRPQYPLSVLLDALATFPALLTADVSVRGLLRFLRAGRAPDLLLFIVSEVAGIVYDRDSPTTFLVGERALRKVGGGTAEGLKSVVENDRHVVAIVVVKGSALELPLAFDDVALIGWDESIQGRGVRDRRVACRQFGCLVQAATRSPAERRSTTSANKDSP